MLICYTPPPSPPPPLPPQAKERVWITNETLAVLRDIRHGLNDCYALLAPVDPGSTLVVSTPRAEKVKGTITRVGTQIVKGTLQIQLATQQPATLTISPANPITIAPLATIHTHLTQCTDLASLLLSGTVNSPPSPSSADSPSLPAPTPEHLYDHLRIISHALADSIALLSGPPKPARSSSSATRPSSANPPSSSPSSTAPPAHAHPQRQHHLSVAPPPPPALSTDWTTASVSPAHFLSGLPPWTSAHFCIRDSFVTLALRALEPADAPVNLGIKFALAIGTMRRLEHDEMNRVFRYIAPGPLSEQALSPPQHHLLHRHSPGPGDAPGPVEVYVREKVEIESADPCLMSLASKLSSLTHTLAQARRNLAVVMGVEFEE